LGYFGHNALADQPTIQVLGTAFISLQDTGTGKKTQAQSVEGGLSSLIDTPPGTKKKHPTASNPLMTPAPINAMYRSRPPK
jgi:hypothetical protein